MSLPDPYEKNAQPFEHFDIPEALALHRVKSDVRSGWAYHDQTFAHCGWYGHVTEVNHDVLTVHECGGVEMNVQFSYSRLLKQVETALNTRSLFAL